MFTNLKGALCAGTLLAVSWPLAVAASDYTLNMPSADSISVLRATDNGTYNTLVSPLSLNMLIGLSRAGIDPKSISTKFPETVSLSHAVWFDLGAELTDTATKSLSEDWGAKTAQINLAKEGMQKINQWVKLATNGLIPALIDSPLSNANVAVTTAMYFKDAWATPFPEAQTSERAFTLEGGETVRAEFLVSSDTYPSWQTEEGIYSVLSFDAGGYLLLHLPAAPDSTPPVDIGTAVPFSAPKSNLSNASEQIDVDATTESDVDSAQFDVEVDPDHEPETVEAGDGGASGDETYLQVEHANFVRIAFPKLDMKADLDLREILEALGLDANLDEGMRSLLQSSVLPGPVVQSVVFKADEDGVEAAAAAAAIGVRSLNVPESELIVFDRPFEFYLMMPNDDTAVIAGIVRNPT